MRSILLITLFAACAHTNTAESGPPLIVMRVGQLRPALPTDCKVEFIDAPPVAAMLLLTQVGMITAQTSRFDEPLRESLRKHACDLGGDAITFNVGIANPNVQMLQFLVFRKPPAQPATPPPANNTNTSTGI
jgi:hypothetical protein